nr:hypothetical protein Ade03nite_46070 [Actinoplanes derwentensis]
MAAGSRTQAGVNMDETFCDPIPRPVRTVSHSCHSAPEHQPGGRNTSRDRFQGCHYLPDARFVRFVRFAVASGSSG